jgi:hypothetical protein
MEYINKVFPEAKPLSSLERTILKEIKQTGYEPKDYIWGTSICSDELNNTINVLNKNFCGPGPFRFGGISGIPFTGKTGFAAFASHIPDDGGAFIVYGPHIGISKDGSTGSVQREGQKNPSTCCGSLIAGLNSVKTGNVLNISNNDYQQGQVNKVLTENYQEIKKADDQILATTNVAYKQIKRELSDIISESLQQIGNKQLLLIGGIIINTDWDQEDQFEIRDISWFNK